MRLHQNLIIKGPRSPRGRRLTLALALLLTMGPGLAGAQELPPLRLSPAPAGSGADCDEHPGQPASASARREQGGKPDAKFTGGKPDGRPTGKPGGKPGGRPAGSATLESEHRPQPVRTYSFNELRRLAMVEAFVRRPDGSISQPTLQLGVNPNLTFPTPFGEGPVHGANNVYLVEQDVEDQVLVVRAAQWLTMHHNCGWGHEHKFDPTRTQPQALNTLPIELVINDLWDPNFHAKVTPGQLLTITVLSYGKPLAGARVQLQTEKKWVKEVVTGSDGTASLQLIRDYYPTRWSDFNRTRRGEFLVTARYEAEEDGVLRGKPYTRIRYSTTLPWQYSPAHADYASYGLGLMVGLLGFTLTGGGIYFYRERRKKPYKGISLAG